MFLSFAPAWSFRDRLERGERLRPEAVEIGTQRFKAGPVDRVDATSSFGAVEDKPGVLEYPQVLGDGRATDGKLVSQLAYGTWEFD